MASAAKSVRLDPSSSIPPAADVNCLVHRDFDQFKVISYGSSGVIFKARNLRTDQIVALKRLLPHRCCEVEPKNTAAPRHARVLPNDKDRIFDDEPCWRTEVDFLAACRHLNVVRLNEVARNASGTNVFLIMEYGYTDLRKLLTERSRPFSDGQVKFLMSQLLQGVKCIHDRQILNGDLKPAHILVDYDGDLKICDFSRSRMWEAPMQPSNTDEKTGATLWYTAPELLLMPAAAKKKRRTAAASDMWSMGCIMAELLSKKVLFQGTSKKDQIKKIFQTLGMPDEKMMPGVWSLPEAVQVIRSSKFPWQNILRRRFREAAHPWFPSCPMLSSDGYDLLAGLLNYDPTKRLTAEAALQHPWFQSNSSSSPPAVKAEDIIFPASNLGESSSSSSSSAAATSCHQNKRKTSHEMKDRGSKFIKAK